MLLIYLTNMFIVLIQETCSVKYIPNKPDVDIQIKFTLTRLRAHVNKTFLNAIQVI